MAANDKITPSLNKIKRALNKLPAEAYRVFKSATPKRSGNAQRRTRLVGDTIRADYPYATELDRGSSRQAPSGMATPTTNYLDKRVNQIMRK